MQAQMNTIQQVKNAWGDIRAELWGIEVGIVVPKSAKILADLLAKEKEAAAFLGL